MNSESTQAIIEKMLTTNPPAFSGDDAANMAATIFGIHAQTRLLVSDRDQNFRLDCDDGRRFILKISNPAEQPQFIDFQNRALIYVAEKDDSLPVPRVIPALDGQIHQSVESNGQQHIVRVLSWLDGVVLDDMDVNADVANSLGQLLARLGLALQGFDHPASNPPSLWDMRRASSLRDLLKYIHDPQLRSLIGQSLDRFDSRVKPVMETLRTQVIHNDMNLANVLMDETRPDRISGLIDFGDLVKSPLIFDLAIACSYQLSKGADPLSGALPMIAGYHAVQPLMESEMGLLPDLIRTRLITSLLIGSYRVRLFPENREYLMISFDSARDFLVNMDHSDNRQDLRRIRAACNSA